MSGPVTDAETGTEPAESAPPSSSATTLSNSVQLTNSLGYTATLSVQGSVGAFAKSIENDAPGKASLAASVDLQASVTNTTAGRNTTASFGIIAFALFPAGSPGCAFDGAPTPDAIQYPDDSLTSDGSQCIVPMGEMGVVEELTSDDSAVLQSQDGIRLIASGQSESDVDSWISSGLAPRIAVAFVPFPSFGRGDWSVAEATCSLETRWTALGTVPVVAASPGYCA